jgi:hypothetical protein
VCSATELFTAVAVNYAMQKRGRKEHFFPDDDDRHHDASASASAGMGMHVGGMYGTVGSGGGGGGIRRFDRRDDRMQASSVRKVDASYDDDDNGKGSQGDAQVPSLPQCVPQLLRDVAHADDR